MPCHPSCLGARQLGRQAWQQQHLHRLCLQLEGLLILQRGRTSMVTPLGTDAGLRTANACMEGVHRHRSLQHRCSRLCLFMSCPCCCTTVFAMDCLSKRKHGLPTVCPALAIRLLGPASCSCSSYGHFAGSRPALHLQPPPAANLGCCVVLYQPLADVSSNRQLH